MHKCKPFHSIWAKSWWTRYMHNQNHSHTHTCMCTHICMKAQMHTCIHTHAWTSKYTQLQVLCILFLIIVFLPLFVYLSICLSRLTKLLQRQAQMATVEKTAQIIVQPATCIISVTTPLETNFFMIQLFTKPWHNISHKRLFCDIKHQKKDYLVILHVIQNKD